MITDLMTRSLTIVRRAASGTDDYGNETYTETSTTTVGELQQRTETETLEHQETYTADFLLFLPAGTGIDAGDKVTMEGRTFEVIGLPQRWRLPASGIEHHLEVAVRETTG